MPFSTMPEDVQRKVALAAVRPATWCCGAACRWPVRLGLIPPLQRTMGAADFFFRNAAGSVFKAFTVTVALQAFGKPELGVVHIHRRYVQAMARRIAPPYGPGRRCPEITTQSPGRVGHLEPL